MSAFWGALAFADVLPPAPLNSWGVIKGLLLRNIRYWANQPAILDPSGILTIGFNYPSTFATENYNSPGSPYWAFKAFIPLSLPADHPFWTAEEEPYPTSTLPVAALDHPGHITSHLSPAHTFLLSSGQACHYPLRHGAEKYGKLAYSSAFGYAVPTGALGLDQHAPDSTIALSDDNGERWVVRREVEFARIERSEEGGESWLRALWKPWPGVEVETFLIPPQEASPDWHTRVHRIKVSSTARRGKVLVSDAGFSIHAQGLDGRALDAIVGASSATESGILASASRGAKTPEGKVEVGSEALVRSSAGVSGVADLTPRSQSQTRAGKVIILDANANIIFPRSIMPTITSEVHSGEKDVEVWLVTGVFAVEDVNAVGPDLEARWAKRPIVPGSITKLFDV